MAIDENVVTLDVPVYHRWIMAVQVYEPMQDLSSPAFNGSDINSRIHLPVPVSHLLTSITEPDAFNYMLNKINTYNYILVNWICI